LIIVIVIVIIIIIIMKSSVDRDSNYCHYGIPRNTGFAITLYYYPADCVVISYGGLSSSLWVITAFHETPASQLRYIIIRLIVL
jgi:hypothetical protein